ncbi:hypothetical protein LNKW23_04320 [Paralimibaculum aggregatum]|uniref:Uncharacterized protein n=1 Tax=Paralimibaculum aggregatum TaxID=3036245 RepID=A0ABQ6LLP9_9RHOB|nr:hypothetical protein LNKW23_04320 [Limibaculum sp. NKW23]
MLRQGANGALPKGVPGFGTTTPARGSALATCRATGDDGPAIDDLALGADSAGLPPPRAGLGAPGLAARSAQSLICQAACGEMVSGTH